MLRHESPEALAEDFTRSNVDTSYETDLLEANQQEYLYVLIEVVRFIVVLMRDRLYRDQLLLTERHLDGLIDDANSTLELLTKLSTSFQSVETQTSTFRSQCETLLTEQRRLEKLADEVGTDLYYYSYLDTASRRLNAPGAGKLVDDSAFGDMIEDIDACIKFMESHVSTSAQGRNFITDVFTGELSRARLVSCEIQRSADQSAASHRPRFHHSARQNLF